MLGGGSRRSSPDVCRPPAVAPACWDNDGGLAGAGDTRGPLVLARHGSGTLASSWGGPKDGLITLGDVALFAVLTD